MSHIRKQIRDAVKVRLSTVGSLALVDNESRIVREFQSHNLPAALVSVAEAAEREDNNPEGQRVLRRSMQVSVRLCVRDDDEDAEDTLDALTVEAEKALAVSSELGVGSIVGWVYGGASALSPQPVSDGMLLAVTMTYTCAVLTLDSAPETNLYA